MKASLGPAVWTPSMPLLRDWLGSAGVLYFESNGNSPVWEQAGYVAEEES